MAKPTITPGAPAARVPGTLDEMTVGAPRSSPGPSRWTPSAPPTACATGAAPST
jgi:hypothetical protein